MSKAEKLLAFVFLVLLAGFFVALAHDTISAAPVPLAPPAVQAGTAVIPMDGGTFGFVNVEYDFPDKPILVVSLKTEVETKMVIGRALSGQTGTVIVRLEQPFDGNVEVEWHAVMATALGQTEGK